MDPIQWYPGHMAAAMRRLADDVRLTQVVIEVVDARIPRSGRNPALLRMAARKPRLLVLERGDLAQPRLTADWLRYFRDGGEEALAIDGTSRGSAQHLKSALAKLVLGRRRARAVVVGIPNAGKSTVINALVRKKLARVEDRAGVTRSPQWFRVEPALEVLDTAGILVPRIDTRDAQWKLALCGAVPRARFDAEEVVAHLAAWAQEVGRELPDLFAFARERGFLRRGNILDTHNAAWSYIKEFNDGTFGRMTLEQPP